MKASLRPFHLLLTIFIMSPLVLVAQKTNYVLNLAAISQCPSVTDIFLSSSMLKSSKLDFKDSGIPSLDGIFQNTESMRIFTAEDSEGLNLIRETFAPIYNTQGSPYEMIFSIKSNGAVVRLIGKAHGDRSNELFLLVDDNDEAVAIIFQGNYSRKQINKMLSDSKNTRLTGGNKGHNKSKR